VTDPAPTAQHLDPRSLLRKYNLHARRKLGQNFLISPKALEAVVRAAELAAADTVLEIGAGVGTLTAELARRAGCVVAVELDDALIRVLRAEIGDLPGLHLVHGDIMKLRHTEVLRERCPPATGYKVVANLPYYITSHVLRKLLEEEPRPKIVVVMVQREVAERAVAGPGEMSLLALSVQLYSEPEIVERVPAGAFVPRPEVDSAVLKLRVRGEPLFPDIPPERFFRVAGAGFGQKRKSLLNSLSSNLGLEKPAVLAALQAAGIDPSARAQELGLEDWARLCRTLPQE
jgi:16S rRNA (adenine1518-N6/adenine1519-N6)-dimethyltransferase